MYSTYNNPNETQTVKARRLEINLSDADVKRISEKACEYGLTVSELIENFIGDLVCGTFTNGSDERMYAKEWVNRCNFTISKDRAFVRFLAVSGWLSDVLDLLHYIDNCQNNLASDEADLEEAEEIQAEVEDYQDQIKEYWDAYVLENKGNQQRNFEEEMEKVREWKANYEQLLNS